MILPPQFVNDVRREESIIFCPNCSRILFYYEDFSINDICKITGDKEGTIKSRLKRARDMLKNILREEGYGNEW